MARPVTGNLPHVGTRVPPDTPLRQQVGERAGQLAADRRGVWVGRFTSHPAQEVAPVHAGTGNALVVGLEVPGVSKRPRDCGVQSSGHDGPL